MRTAGTAGPTGVHRQMSPADCASLAAALTADPPSDAGWQEIGRDARDAAADCADR
jgi:hypothetical protein